MLRHSLFPVYIKFLHVLEILDVFHVLEILDVFHILEILDVFHVLEILDVFHVLEILDVFSCTGNTGCIFMYWKYWMHFV